MDKKQKIIITSIIVVVLILATIGVALMSNVKKEDKSSNKDKIPVSEEVEKVEEKEQEPVEESC